MPTIRSLSVLLFVLVSGGGAWWLLKGGDGAGVGEAQQVAPEGEHAAASLHANDGATTLEQKDMNAGERAAIAAPRHAVTGPAIVGRVVDGAGKAVVEAAVQCTPSSSFDPSDFDGGADIDKWAARARDLRQQRTETKSDSDGRFRLALPANGTTLGLRVAARGLVIHTQNLRRPDKGDYDAGTLTLKPAAIVSGRVMDRADKPVAKVTVRCDRGDSGMMDFDMDNGLGEAFADLAADDASTLTDREGRFELAHVTPGALVISARDAEHPTTRRKDLQVEPGGTLADVVLTLEPGATIRGKVVGVPDGVKGLRVLAARREGADGTAQTRVFLGGGDADMDVGERGANPAADGTFTLRGLVLARSYRVFLTQRGVGFMGSGACSPKVDVLAGAEGVELRYEPGITVTFHVVDARSQTPVERLWVGSRMQGGGGFADFFNQTGRARDYEQGAVTLANLRPKKKQTLSLSVEATGFKKFAREGIELPLRGALDLGTVQLQPVPVIRVQVTSALDGQPVVGALVQVAAKDPAAKDRGRRNLNGLPDFNMVAGMGAGGSSPLSAKTDVDGRCTVNAVPGAEVVVSVTSSEFAPYASAPLALPETTDAEHTVRLLRGGSVVVDVVDADGKPAAKANVSHRPAVGEPSNIATDAQGRAAFVRLAPGEHRFRVGRGGDQPGFTFDLGGGAIRSTQIADASSARADDWKKVEVVDGVEAALRLTLEATARVTGIVRENGKPLVGAEVGFVAGSDAESPVPAMMRSRGVRQQTDDQGRYQLADVRTGEHRLRVTHRERAMPALVAVSLRAGDNVFDIDLDMTVLRGVVRGPDDKPVAGASVRATEAAAAGSEPSRGIQAAVEANAMFGGRRDGAGGSTKTDAQGRYELRGVSAERSVVVKATAKGLASGEAKPVTPARGSTTEGIDVRLSGAGAIRVRSATDVAFAAAQATFLGDDKSVAPAFQMLNKGEALLEGLRPGRWKVRLGMPGDAQAPTREVDVQAGATSEVSF